MDRQTTIAEVKAKCPVFAHGQCPYTGLKPDLAKSEVFDHGCIVTRDQCKTIGDVTDVLASLVPKNEEGKKIMAHAIQEAVLLGYNDEKKCGKTCPRHQTWPFNTDKDGKPVFAPQTAIDSVYVTMDTIKTKCPVFEKGKACPYSNIPGLKEIAKGCPHFKSGCPFKDVKDVGEFRRKLGEMTDKCQGVANHNKALGLICEVNKEQAAKVGHCPFHAYGCQVNEDLKGEPITNDFVDMDTIKNKCPVFQKGKFCPYNVPCLDGLAKGCPEFKDGICPFKSVKTIGELKAKLGEMRDKCKGTEKHDKALDIIAGANGVQVAKFGHCPFFKFGCMLKTDKNGKPNLPEGFTMQYVRDHCPSFQKGKFCPYNVPELKGLAKDCTAFTNGCPFKHVKNVGEFEAKLGEMRNECKGKANYKKALNVVHAVNGQQAAKIGHCPFFKFECPLKTDLEGKPIIPDTVTLDYVSHHCPAFENGTACPYDVTGLKGLGKGCPSFKDGCPFKGVKTIGDLKGKMGEMRDQCKAKATYSKAMDFIHGANGEEVAKHGHCPFFKDGCILKTDTNGRFIMPEAMTMEYVKGHCPVFDKGKACPYNVAGLKGLGKGCPSFKDGCPFKGVKNVGELQAKLGEMRDKCKGKANYTKAFELVFEANKEGAAKHGHCPFHHNHCELKTDPQGKPIL